MDESERRLNNFLIVSAVFLLLLLASMAYDYYAYHECLRVHPWIYCITQVD